MTNTGRAIISASSKSFSRSKQRHPIHYRFISIDEECQPSSSCTSTSTTTPSSSESPTSTSSSSPSPASPSCFSLLQQFYNELMIPTFPLEEERDDIEDWFECFRDQMKLRRYRMQQQHNRKDVKDFLIGGLKEEANTNNDDGEEEEDCDFEGPAMDVILMVQEMDDGVFDPSHDIDDDGCGDDVNNDNGTCLFKKSSRSLLRSQSSLYGGLYAPKEEDANADDITNAHHHVPKRSSSGSLLRSSQSSLHASTISEDVANDTTHSQGEKYIIIGGAAVEYYKQSRVGLLSYVVLHNEFRGCGLAKHLHKEALSRLEMLANCYGTAPMQKRTTTTTTTELLAHPLIVESPTQNNNPPLLQAIFAETNTPAAGDVTPEQSLLRHKSLFHLGYRLVKFPYAQPPLSTKDMNATFDDIVLLVYFPFFDNDNCEQHQLERNNNLMMKEDDAEARFKRELILKRYCPWFLEGQSCCDTGRSNNGNHLNTVQMNIQIPFQYIEDFYQSVFGYDSEEEETNSGNIGSESDGGEGIPDYRTANYYKLAHWFTHHNRRQSSDSSKGVCVEVSLCHPTATSWEDCKDSCMVEWKEWQEMQHQK